VSLQIHISTSTIQPQQQIKASWDVKHSAHVDNVKKDPKR